MGDFAMKKPKITTQKLTFDEGATSILNTADVEIFGRKLSITTSRAIPSSINSSIPKCP